MKTILVPLEERSYPIFIGAGLLDKAGALSRKHLPGVRRLILITNPIVGKLFAKSVCEAFRQAGFSIDLLQISDGEKHKNLHTAEIIYHKLARLNADRDTALIALGGGVIGDLTGFVAATYLRGLPFIQIPTTLLAQVDSSVGGKTGVNLPAGKNLVGCFYQPKAVIIDPDTLKTLPAREIQTGMAEVIKYGMIRSASLFASLEKGNQKIDAVIAECCQIKADVVSADEKESNLRMILNFGHTIGHALETLTNYQSYTHGEAVAIGMVAASKLAVNMKLFSEGSAGRLTALLKKTGLPTRLPSVNIRRLMTIMQRDKKARDSKLIFVLPTRIGDVEIVRSVSAQQVNAALVEMIIGEKKI